MVSGEADALKTDGIVDQHTVKIVKVGVMKVWLHK